MNRFESAAEAERQRVRKAEEKLRREMETLRAQAQIYGHNAVQADRVGLPRMALRMRDLQASAMQRSEGSYGRD